MKKNFSYLRSQKNSSHLCSYITLQVVGLSSLNHIIGVWQASPLVEVSPVVEVIDLNLAFLGQLNSEHIYWEVELCLGLIEVFLVDIVTGDLGCMSS